MQIKRMAAVLPLLVLLAAVVAGPCSAFKAEEFKVRGKGRLMSRCLPAAPVESWCATIIMSDRQHLLVPAELRRLRFLHPAAWQHQRGVCDCVRVGQGGGGARHRHRRQHAGRQRHALPGAQCLWRHPAPVDQRGPGEGAVRGARRAAARPGAAGAGALPTGCASGPAWAAVLCGSGCLVLGHPRQQ